MPWRQTSYHRVYHFKRRWIVLSLLVTGLVLAALTVYWAPRYLLDPDYVPQIDDFQTRRCRKGSCILGLGLYLLLLLPVWIKTSIAGFAATEILTRWFAYGFWSFDRRPDFGIGPYGIYGLSGLRYYHVPWSHVPTVQVHRTDDGDIRSIVFVTSLEVPTRLLGIFPRTHMVKFTLAPVHGFNVREILSFVEQFAPRKL